MTSKRWTPVKFTMFCVSSSPRLLLLYWHVDADKGSEVLQMMPPNIQEQVVERVGAMETTPMDQIEVVANTLGSRIGKKGQSPSQDRWGQVGR